MSFFEFPHTRTYDSDLGWIIKTVHTHDEILHALDEWADKTDLRLDALEDFKNTLERGDLPEAVRNALYEWAAIHIPDLLAKAIKTVFFYLNDEGYFVAVIPDSWDEITFGTSGLDTFPIGIDYGHLTLSY